jgi:hypothetical protein
LTDEFVEDVIMNFNFAKVTTIFIVLNRAKFSWIRANQTDSHNDNLVEQRYQGHPAGSGMFGLLVSSDVAQGYLR